MRRCLTCSAVVVLFLALGCSEQPDEAPPADKVASTATADTLKGTKMALFASQVGAVILMNYTRVGQVYGAGGTSISVQAREFVDASNDSSQYGLYVEVSEGLGDYDRSNASYLDYDEIQPLIDGLDYIAQIDTSITSLDNFEAHYRTRGDFELITFNSFPDNQINLSAKSGTIGGATAFFRIAQYPELLPKIRNLFLEGKETLDSIK